MKDIRYDHHGEQYEFRLPGQYCPRCNSERIRKYTNGVRAKLQPNHYCETCHKKWFG